MKKEIGFIGAGKMGLKANCFALSGKLTCIAMSRVAGQHNDSFPGS